MSVIDWDKAPEGATHYCAKGSSHNGLEYGEHWLKPGFYRLPHWKKWEEDKCRAPESILVARPSPAWSGEGLPPVGAVCEMRDDHGSWHRSTVIAHGVEFGEKVAMGQADNMVLWCKVGYHCRPIRTPEQIAADEREAQIVAIHDAIVTSVKVTLGQQDSWRQVAEMVYNAGFKRE